MLKLQPLSKNPTLADIILRVIRATVQVSGGWFTDQSGSDKKIQLLLYMKNEQYIVTLTLLKNGNSYTVSEFSSFEKDSDIGAPYWMPAEWTLSLSLKPGDKWIINKASDMLALFEAHNKWSKFEGYHTVFEGKDKNI